MSSPKVEFHVLIRLLQRTVLLLDSFQTIHLPGYATLYTPKRPSLYAMVAHSNAQCLLRKMHRYKRKLRFKNWNSNRRSSSSRKMINKNGGKNNRVSDQKHGLMKEEHSCRSFHSRSLVSVGLPSVAVRHMPTSSLR